MRSFWRENGFYIVAALVLLALVLVLWMRSSDAPSPFVYGPR